MSCYEYTQAQVLELLYDADQEKQREGLAACLYLTAANEEIDDCCRRMLVTEAAEIQLLAAFAVASRGLFDCVHILVGRLTSEDWQSRLEHAGCIEALLQDASDEHLLDMAEDSPNWLAYMSCVILARRWTDNQSVYRLLDELESAPEIRSIMNVPSPEIEERWAAIIRTTI